MVIHRSRAVQAIVALMFTGAAFGCGGRQGTSKSPAAASAGPTKTTTPPSRGATAEQGAQPHTAAQPRVDEHRTPAGAGPDQQGPGDADDAELVVSRDVVQRCPVLRFVRAHAGDLDPDTVWLAVLESVADCMSDGGPMAHDAIGVSGDEEHRHVVREVLSFKGIAPERVVARPVSAEGAAECQGGDCNKRVEITIAPH